jgi:hypothetical protein
VGCWVTGLRERGTDGQLTVITSTMEGRVEGGGRIPRSWDTTDTSQKHSRRPQGPLCTQKGTHNRRSERQAPVDDTTRTHTPGGHSAHSVAPAAAL